MAEIDNTVMSNVVAFLERLKAEGIQVAEAYLFGSQLTGKADEWSDIDVAVVSPQISDDRFEERVRLTQIAFSVDERIEPLPFAPETFTSDDPLVRQILHTGRPL
ncbi:MAG: nucleotidyltransferase domain-containing protein [Candidatus Electrothrix scaldis]|nr:MAG: nucleotidyltransferase domain-containing protein [Candidatus Electrothrix sp. GW3-3]